MATHQLFEESQTIHPRHLDIESEYIGIERLDFFPGHKRILCCADHFQFRIRAENLRQQLAHERRIIDDKHLIGWAHLYGPKSPSEMNSRPNRQALSLRGPGVCSESPLLLNFFTRTISPADWRESDWEVSASFSVCAELVCVTRSICAMAAFTWSTPELCSADAIAI